MVSMTGFLSDLFSTPLLRLWGTPICPSSKLRSNWIEDWMSTSSERRIATQTAPIRVGTFDYDGLLGLG
jgi:hypothetical protein